MKMAEWRPLKVYSLILSSFRDQLFKMDQIQNKEKVQYGASEKWELTSDFDTLVRSLQLLVVWMYLLIKSHF